jgi:hypothetical protein
MFGDIREEATGSSGILNKEALHNLYVYSSENSILVI